MRLRTAARLASGVAFVGVGACGASIAQDLPTDAQMQAAFATVYNISG